MRFRIISAIFLLIVYLLILFPFSRYMGQKPYAEKLGLIPHSGVLKVFFADYEQLVASSILTRVFLYFGSLLESEESPGKLVLAADYPAMSRAIHTGLLLDPYNMDGYYFGQSILAWDAGQYQLANELLEYGMQYRTWDWQLPFFSGFNYAFFLNNREAAADMYMRAGNLSGSAMFKSLAGRYLQEAGKTQLAVDYLRVLEKDARDPGIKKSFQVRLRAFEAVLSIEKARDLFRAEQNVEPADIEELVNRGYLDNYPIDPYGGRFYLDEQRAVRSTSRFSFASQSSIPNTFDRR